MRKSSLGILVFLIAANVGLHMVAWCTAISWGISLIYAAVWYRTGRWKKLKLI